MGMGATDHRANDKTNVYYLGLQNWLNGAASSLFIGEKELVKTVMKRQKYFLENIQGWVTQQESESHLVLGATRGGSPVITLSMIELSQEDAEKYHVLKRKAEEKHKPFFGIVTDEAGKTDILHPIDPDTGELELSDI